ncbi:MAG TPA: AMP-binding protein, partial [Longimicrobium sp.]|nr:AMP-binding protein [Longimicrobium sp.]
DNTAVRLLREEVRAHLLGRAAELAAPLPFRDYVARTRMGASRDAHEAYFRELLADVDEPTTPFGLVDASAEGSRMVDARLQVEPRLAARLRERARRLGVTAASVFHLAWAQVVARAAGRDDVVFGTVLFGRMRGGEGADRVMGPFINSLPVRVRVGVEGVEESVRGVHLQLAELLRHEHASLTLAQRCSGVAAPAPLFTALLNYRQRRGSGAPGAPDASGDLDGVRELRGAGQGRSSYPLTLSVDDQERGLSFKVFAPASVGPGSVCAMVHRALEGIVDALETAPARPVGEVDVVPATVRRRVLEMWNGELSEPADGATAHGLFEAWAQRTPDAVAVACEGRQLTYAELDAAANRLAHHLGGMGVGPDARVAICLERGVEIVVALLAVLKAGGAYLPLDAEYPEGRLRELVARGSPAVVLTGASLAGRFAGIEVPVVALDGDAADWAELPATRPLSSGVAAEQLAYVIHTSGSTGAPKGVMVTHAALLNYVRAAIRRLEIGEGWSHALVSTFAADLGNTVLFPALATGGTLHVVPQAALTDPERLAGCFARRPADVLKIVPSHLEALLSGADPAAVLPRRRLVLGGEAPRASSSGRGA